MSSGTDHDIEQLNALIAVTHGSAQGYMDAAANAKSSKFSTLFRKRGIQRHDIAERLQTRVNSLASKPGDIAQGDIVQSGKMRFAGLKQKMGGSEASIIAEVEACEDHVKEVFEKVVLDAELSDPVRMAVESEFAQIKASHDEMRDLKQATS